MWQRGLCLTVEITIWLSVNYLYVQLLIMIILSDWIHWLSWTSMSATPCTCVSCLQSRDATSFLAPATVGMKCSVTVTLACLLTSLRKQRKRRHGRETLMQHTQYNRNQYERVIRSSELNCVMIWTECRSLLFSLIIL